MERESSGFSEVNKVILFCFKNSYASFWSVEMAALVS